jgi:hypothetical protein
VLLPELPLRFLALLSLLSLLAPSLSLPAAAKYLAVSGLLLLALLVLLPPLWFPADSVLVLHPLIPLSQEDPPMAETQKGPRLTTQRYEDLTAAETVSMTEGHRLIIAGDADKAERVIQLSLDLEHLISVIPLDFTKADPADLADLKELRDNLEAIAGIHVRLHVFGERSTDPKAD